MITKITSDAIQDCLTAARFGRNFRRRRGPSRLPDLSAFQDAVLNTLMEQLYDEFMRRKACPLRGQGLAQVMALQ